MTVSHYVLFEGEHPELYNPHTSLEKLVNYESIYRSTLHLGEDFDTACLRIDKQDYSCIYRLERQSDTTVTNAITITTRFNHRDIRIAFESRLSKTKDSAFIKESLEAIKTIRLEKY
jgi:hypothetical protein